MQLLTHTGMSKDTAVLFHLSNCETEKFESTKTPKIDNQKMFKSAFTMLVSFNM